MLSRKKILTLLSAVILIALLTAFFNSQKSPPKKVLDSKATVEVSPTLVYTPSITPSSQEDENSLPIPSFSPKDLYIVEKVIDGDTITVSQRGNKETIRLIGINTPETVDPRRPVDCFGKEASDNAKELLTGSKVYLEEDATQGSRDKYSRLLRYVYREDGLFYNLFMIKNGLAYEYTYDLPYKYTQEFKSAQKTAELQKIGLWADGVCSTQKINENKVNNNSVNTPQGVGDKDCSDFTKQIDAQDFFIAQGGPGSDPHK